MSSKKRVFVIFDLCLDMFVASVMVVVVFSLWDMKWHMIHRMGCVMYVNVPVSAADVACFHCSM